MGLKNQIDFRLLETKIEKWNSEDETKQINYLSINWNEQRILTFRSSVIDFSLWMNSVVERAFSDRSCKFCDSSVWNKGQEKTRLE